MAMCNYFCLTTYAALKALYESTNGTKWRNRQGWDFSSDTPPLPLISNPGNCTYPLFTVVAIDGSDMIR